MVKEVIFIKIKIKFNKWILLKYGKLCMKEISVKNVKKIVN